MRGENKQLMRYNESHVKQIRATVMILIINDGVIHTLFKVLKKQFPLLRDVGFDPAVPSNKTFMCPDGFFSRSHFCGRYT